MFLGIFNLHGPFSLTIIRNFSSRSVMSTTIRASAYIWNLSFSTSVNNFSAPAIIWIKQSLQCVQFDVDFSLIRRHCFLEFYIKWIKQRQWRTWKTFIMISIDMVWRFKNTSNNINHFFIVHGKQFLLGYQFFKLCQN